jgi:hypothetical protein
MRKTNDNVRELENAIERGVILATGEHIIEAQLPLNISVTQDRTFDRDNQLIYLTGHRMEQMTDFLDDGVMVSLPFDGGVARGGMMMSRGMMRNYFESGSSGSGQRIFYEHIIV